MWITAYPNRGGTDTNFEFEFWVEGEAHGFFNKVYFRADNGTGYFVISLLFFMTVIGICTGCLIFFYCKEKFLSVVARICAKCPRFKKKSDDGHVELSQVQPTMLTDTNIQATDVHDISK